MSWLVLAKSWGIPWIYYLNAHAYNMAHIYYIRQLKQTYIIPCRITNFHDTSLYIISIYSFWIKHLRTIPGEATLCALPAESQGRRPRQTDGLGARVVVGGFSVGMGQAGFHTVFFGSFSNRLLAHSHLKSWRHVLFYVFFWGLLICSLICCIEHQPFFNWDHDQKRRGSLGLG